MKTMITAAAFALTMGVSAAQASVFQIDYHNTPLKVWQAYDEGSETYSMRFMPGQNEDGFWLVVSDGMNPKGNSREYAILYGDLNTNRVTAYTYDGNNSERSYETGEFLGSYDNAFTFRDDGKIDFALDVSDINNAFDDPDWDGVAFDDRAGIWFHRSADTNFEYDENGQIIDYNFSGQSWLDRGNDPTNDRGMTTCAAGQGGTFGGRCTDVTQVTPPTGVAAPGGILLVLAGLAGLVARRRRQTA